MSKFRLMLLSFWLISVLSGGGFAADTSTWIPLGNFYNKIQFLSQNLTKEVNQTVEYLNKENRIFKSQQVKSLQKSLGILGQYLETQQLCNEEQFKAKIDSETLVPLYLEQQIDQVQVFEQGFQNLTSNKKTPAKWKDPLQTIENQLNKLRNQLMGLLENWKILQNEIKKGNPYAKDLDKPKPMVNFELNQTKENRFREKQYKQGRWSPTNLNDPNKFLEEITKIEDEDEEKDEDDDIRIIPRFSIKNTDIKRTLQNNQLWIYCGIGAMVGLPVAATIGIYKYGWNSLKRKANKIKVWIQNEPKNFVRQLLRRYIHGYNDNNDDDEEEEYEDDEYEDNIETAKSTNIDKANGTNDQDPAVLGTKSNVPPLQIPYKQSIGGGGDQATKPPWSLFNSGLSDHMFVMLIVVPVAVLFIGALLFLVFKRRQQRQSNEQLVNISVTSKRAKMKQKKLKRSSKQNKAAEANDKNSNIKESGRTPKQKKLKKKKGKPALVNKTATITSNKNSRKQQRLQRQTTPNCSKKNPNNQ